MPTIHVIPESEAAFGACPIELLADQSGFITSSPWI